MIDNEFNGLPEAQVEEKKTGVSIVWLLPLVAVLIGAWLVYKTFSEQGPSITLRFHTAEGIEANKTKVKYLDVEVGLVTTVEIAEDASGVILTVEMHPELKPWLTDETRFWVVRPRIGAGGVSGIGTLLSGAYIGMDPSRKGRPTKHFTGLDEPPNVFSNTPGTRYLLNAEDSTLAVGSPVLFRGIKVGEVIGNQLAEDHSHVNIEIFVRAPHDRYVSGSTRFWDASGVDVDLSSSGLNVEMGSLVTVIAGGVAFETSKPGEQAPPNTRYTLFKSRKQSEEKRITITVPYALRLQESVRGLSVGAPVEFRGIRIGSVKDIQFSPDLKHGDTFIAVMIDLEPQRIPIYPNQELPPSAGRVDKMAQWVEKGLRARLQTGNLLTGQRFVELNMFPDAEPAEIVFDHGIPVLPTVPGQLESMTDSMARILHKLENLPIEEIGRNLEETTAGANRLVNSGETQHLVAKLTAVLEATNTLLANLRAASKDVQPLLEASTTAVQQADATLAAFQDMASEDSPVSNDLRSTLQEFKEAARSFRILAEYLERHPDALLRGKGAR